MIDSVQQQSLTYQRKLENFGSSLIINIATTLFYCIENRGLFTSEYRNYMHLMLPLYLKAVRLQLNVYYLFHFRHQKDGVQNSTVARKMLFLPCLQNTHWNQVIYSS